MNQFRQGDVLIERVNEIPNEVKNALQPSKEPNKLLIRGESRNHGHYIKGEVETYVIPNPEIEKLNITHYLEIKEEASLEHINIDSKLWSKEHETLRLKPGIYRVIRQREYNPYLKAINIIKD